MYKPNPKKCISLQYTIRLPVEQFSISKSQKSVFKKVKHYLNGMQKVKKETTNQPEKDVTMNSHQKCSIILELEHALQSIILESLQKSWKEILPSFDPSAFQTTFDLEENKNKKFGDVFSAFVVKYSSAVTKKYASELKQKPSFNEFAKLCVSQCRTSLPSSIQKLDVAPNGFINMWLTEEAKQRLETEKKALLIPKEQKSSKSSEAESEWVQMGEKKKLTVTMKPSEFSEEAFELYKKYQIAVHHDKEDEVTPKGYTNFLVTSPLTPEQTGYETNSLSCEDDIPGLEGISEFQLKSFQGYGSFHVEYRIDNKLVMVAVVDICQLCLSSVYVFYDPDLSKILNPGIFSALMEIHYVKQVQKILPDLKYYYMGLYINSCQKMLYKASFEPSDLLDPVYLIYVPFADCKEVVEKDSDYKKTKPEDRSLVLIPKQSQVLQQLQRERELFLERCQHVEEVNVLFNQRRLTFETVKTRLKNYLNDLDEKEEKLKLYKQLVGEVLCQDMVYVLEQE